MGSTTRISMGALLWAALMIGAKPREAAGQHGSNQLKSRPATSVGAKVDSATFVKQFPVALVYEGIARFNLKDYDRAIAAFDQYLKTGDTNADTASVKAMIHEAWIHQFPLALIYEGYGRYLSKDVAGAVTAWNRYIELQPKGDSVWVRDLIAGALESQKEELAGPAK